MSSSMTALLQKIDAKTALVGVIGLGYVGLPFAVEAGKVGFTVLGFDLDESKVASVNAGKNYIGDVKDAELEDLVGKKLITATSDSSRMSDCDVLIICVPTPLDKNLNPDLGPVLGATRAIAKTLRAGQLVSLESTTYPGTTEEQMLPLLIESGLKVEEDFFLAHSPERVDPSNEKWHTKNTPKVLGGFGPKSLEVADKFYSTIIDTMVKVSSCKAAELTKVFENTFRAVNIGFVNEMCQLCDRMEINVWEVLDAAYTKPFGIMKFYPGPGVGGHCIPIDPHYLEWKAREYHFDTAFISLAGRINRSMPDFVVDKAMRILNNSSKAIRGAKVAMMGVAYKANTDDWRESPALEVYEKLLECGAIVTVIDDYVHAFEVGGKTVNAQNYSAELVANADITIIITNHKNMDYSDVVEHSKAILDTRNACTGIDDCKVVRL